jgi:hypothetical protein
MLTRLVVLVCSHLHRHVASKLLPSTNPDSGLSAFIDHMYHTAISPPANITSENSVRTDCPSVEKAVHATDTSERAEFRRHTLTIT